MLLQLLLVAMVITNCFIHYFFGRSLFVTCCFQTNYIVLQLFYVATCSCYYWCYHCCVLNGCVIQLLSMFSLLQTTIVATCYQLSIKLFYDRREGISRQLLYYDKHTLFSVNILTTINLNIKQNPFCGRSRRHFLPFYKTRSPG